MFYIRGGFTNIAGADAADPERQLPRPRSPLPTAPTIAGAKSGDDDHPAYSDRQISEAMAARVINAVAGNAGAVEAER